MRFLLSILFLAAILHPSAAWADIVFTTPDQQIVDAGYIKLEWTNEAAVPIRLEQARLADFSDAVAIYEGAGDTLFVSGLSDGDYFFRVVDAKGAASSVLAATVQHQPLDRALMLLALGAATTLATVFVILKGARDDA